MSNANIAGPSLDPAAPPAPPAPPAEVIDITGEEVEVPEKTLDAKGLMDAIVEELGLDIDTYVMIPEFERFSIQGVRWDVGQAPPGNDSLRLFYIGAGSGGDQIGDHLAGDIRAYCRPASTAVAPESHSWRVYTFNRGRDNDTMMSMPQATWLQMIVNEKRDLAIALEITLSEEEADAAAEAAVDERERCVAWLRANALENAAARMVKVLEAEDEAEAGEEEDEEEEDEEEDE
jgi:hypothetical protein